ncbi:MAG: hypothetical protein ACLP50_29815 [Solirubrobacteraceae bacterium]|jgi:hypothetical protein
MSNTTVTYIVGAGCGVIGLVAFCLFLLVPVVSAFRGPLQRMAAVVLSLYVLAAFVGIGVLLGAVIILEWPRVF